jgi:hypothetical protein
MRDKAEYIETGWCYRVFLFTLVYGNQGHKLRVRKNGNMEWRFERQENMTVIYQRVKRGIEWSVIARQHNRLT